jgi:hypothetical protein
MTRETGADIQLALRICWFCSVVSLKDIIDGNRITCYIIPDNLLKRDNQNWLARSVDLTPIKLFWRLVFKKRISKKTTATHVYFWSLYKIEQKKIVF